jgi:hypothetical protein
MHETIKAYFNLGDKCNWPGFPSIDGAAFLKSVMVELKRE